MGVGGVGMGCGDRCVASSRGLCVPRGVRWYVYLSRCPYRLLQLCQGWDWRGWTPAETAFPQRVRSNVRGKQTAESTGSRMLMICSLDAKADNTPVLFLARFTRPPVCPCRSNMRSIRSVPCTGGGGLAAASFLGSSDTLRRHSDIQRVTSALTGPSPESLRQPLLSGKVHECTPV